MNKLPTMCCSKVLEALVGINSKSSRFVYPDVTTWLTSYSQWCRSCLASKKLKLRFVRVFSSCEIVSSISGPQVIPALSFERTKINFLLFNFVRFFHSPMVFFFKKHPNRSGIAVLTLESDRDIVIDDLGQTRCQNC